MPSLALRLIATCCLVLPSTAAAQALPEPTDLLAAYCSQALASEISVTEKAVASFRGSHASLAETFENHLIELRAKRTRLTNYLIPRVAHLDPYALAAAIIAANDDIKAAERDAQMCASAPDEAKCLESLSTNSNAMSDLKRCHKSGLLPY